jgi:hypothetical protein
MNAITTTLITTSFDLKCPHCGAPVLTVHPKSVSVPGGGNWLRDGDTIPGLSKKLTPEQHKGDNSFECELLVGSRPCCSKDYFAIFAKIASSNLSDDDADGYLRGAFSVPNPSAFTATDGSSEWLLFRHTLPTGEIVDEHIFGPFILEESIEGRNGVSACSGDEGNGAWTFASNLLLSKWDAMRELAKQ